jgi:plasmid stability protein
MTQQEILHIARQVLVRRLTRDERAALRAQAVAYGRSIEAASRASTMRLAQWARNIPSPI